MTEHQRNSIDDITPEEWNQMYLESLKKEPVKRSKYFVPAQDDNVNKVVESYLVRAAAGMEKYGKTTDENPLSLIEWITHAQEELQDATIYLERIKTEINKNGL